MCCSWERQTDKHSVPLDKTMSVPLLTTHCFLFNSLTATGLLASPRAGFLTRNSVSNPMDQDNDKRLCYRSAGASRNRTGRSNQIMIRRIHARHRCRQAALKISSDQTKQFFNMAASSVDLVTEHSFKFTSLPVEQQLYTDLAPLNQIAPEALQVRPNVCGSVLFFWCSLSDFPSIHPHSFLSCLCVCLSLTLTQPLTSTLKHALFLLSFLFFIFFACFMFAGCHRDDPVLFGPAVGRS